MINKIIDGISLAINACFGNEYEIYKEPIEQGLKEPCFSVFCLNSSIEQYLGNKYFRQNKFCIHYFPKGPDKRTECYAVIEKLMDALEIITADGDSIRGSKMSGEVVDGGLNFFINYDIFVYGKEVVTPTMDRVSHSTGVKG